MVATVIWGCMVPLGVGAADTEISFAAHFKAQVDPDRDDDQGLSLRDLREDEDGDEEQVDDDSSTDSILGLGDEEDADEMDDREDDSDQEDDARKIAKSKRDAIDSALSRLRKPITQVRVVNAFNDDGPENLAIQGGSQLTDDNHISITITDSGAMIPRYQRKTVCFSHRPLYFQDSNLERCGNGRGCLTNAFSAVHFLGSVALLPYKIGKQHPNCPVHSGGDCRCGQAIPTDLDLLPIDLHAATAQAAALAGFSLLLL